MVDVARGVVVYRRVRRREPFANVLLYLVPCSRVSVFIRQAVEITKHEHVISFVIVNLACLEPMQTKVQRKVKD